MLSQALRGTIQSCSTSAGGGLLGNSHPHDKCDLHLPRAVTGRMGHLQHLWVWRASRGPSSCTPTWALLPPPRHRPHNSQV